MARNSRSRKHDKSSSRSRSTSRSSYSSSSTSSSSSSSSSPSSSASSRSSSSAATSKSPRSDTSKGDKRRTTPPATTRVLVNRLTKNVNKNHILEIFKSYGPVKAVDLPVDRYHPQLSRGSAYIDFEKSEDADKAIRYMDGGQIDGKEITVMKVASKSNKRIKSSSRNGSWKK